MKTSYLATLLFISPLLAYSSEVVPPPPPLPTADETSAELNLSDPQAFPEPEVSIIQHSMEVIEEYRIGGHLYMIKVTPQAGAAYYLVDTDGDGTLETRRDRPEPNLLVPMWILFRW